MKETESGGIAPLYNAVEKLRVLDQEMQLQQVATYLAVAARGEIKMRDLADLVGLSQASVSRNVAALSDWHRLRRPGLGLVEAYEDLGSKGRSVASA